MSPRTKEQFDEIRTERKEQILRVALELFAHNGYHPTTIATIAKEANVSKGLMYNYFESKEMLLKELIITTSEKVHVELDANHDGKVTPAEFIRFIKVTMKNIRENVIYWRLYTTVLLQNDVMDILMGEMQNIAQDSLNLLYDFFNQEFGDRATEELNHLSAVFKGIMLQYLAIKDKKWMDENEKMLLNYYKDKKGWNAL
jgi:AcrR family transcriptional regulator